MSPETQTQLLAACIRALKFLRACGFVESNPTVTELKNAIAKVDNEVHE